MIHPSAAGGGASPAKTAAQAEMLFNRLKKRQRHLKKWAARTGTEAYRLYDRDIPEIPLILDRYQDAIAGALYRRPYEKDEGEERRWLSAMREAASQALEIPPARIFLKERKPQGPGAQYRKRGEEGFIREVREGGLVFQVNLSDYLDTGLFLDRRKMRSLVRAEAGGKRVLNLFCYTGSFSLYAADGGAAAVDSVDMSRTYLEWAARNFGLNRLPVRFAREGELLEGRGSNRENRVPFTLVRSEALSFLARAEQAALRWDTIILDPPGFSNSKKMMGTLDIRRDHGELISRCLALLETGGTLWFSVNARHFRLEEGEFPSARELGEELLDEDFRGRKVPRCYVFHNEEV